MSYSRNYSTSVSYSGSVSYTYPRSESGGNGTAHYSGTIPIDVTINVDTTPFDGSVRQFNNSVDALTGAVVAMNSAQCAAIQQTANEVSNTIIKGFFSTIKTELMQQISALNNSIKATFALIMEQGKAISQKKEVLEGDYNRISSRYITIFNDLDNELNKRVNALDKPAFNLANVQEELLSKKSTDAAAINFLEFDEVAASKTMILVSSLNRKSLEILQTLHDYITQESRLTLLIESLLFNEDIADIIPFFVPVIWIENDLLEGSSVKNESFIPDYFNDQEKQVIADKTTVFCSGLLQDKWRTLSVSENETIRKEFSLLTESHFEGLEDKKEQRVYQTMLSLWKNSEFLTL